MVTVKVFVIDGIQGWRRWTSEVLVVRWPSAFFFVFLSLVSRHKICEKFNFAIKIIITLT